MDIRHEGREGSCVDQSLCSGGGVGGAVVPEHTHPHEQTGYCIRGSLRFFGGGEETIVAAGDCWNFAPGAPHGAEALEDSVVIEVFSPIREDYLPHT